ncbi:MAG: PqqD family protein [Clostridia bacterium]|nr:PqqD family protein [Clostridia bacterium]
MKIKKGFVIRKVGDAHVVVPVGELSKTFHGMINLNETGAFLWNFFTTEHTVDEAVAALCAEYDVEEERARLDAEKFAEILKKNAFIE